MALVGGVGWWRWWVALVRKSGNSSVSFVRKVCVAGGVWVRACVCVRASLCACVRPCVRTSFHRQLQPQRTR